MLQRVRMLKTLMGVRDGEIYPVAFVEGEEYEIGDALLQSFIDLGAVDLEKSRGGSPANKMKAAAPENKSKR